MAIQNVRVIQKHDTEVNWNKATNFIPLAGEIIVYDDLQLIKIGDGITTVINLPFAGGGPSDTPYTYGTEDLTAGTSELETGKLYFVYE